LATRDTPVEKHCCKFIALSQSLISLLTPQNHTFLVGRSCFQINTLEVSVFFYCCIIRPKNIAILGLFSEKIPSYKKTYQKNLFKNCISKLIKIYGRALCMTFFISDNKAKASHFQSTFPLTLIYHSDVFHFSHSYNWHSINKLSAWLLHITLNLWLIHTGCVTNLD